MKTWPQFGWWRSWISIIALGSITLGMGGCQRVPASPDITLPPPPPISSQIIVLTSADVGHSYMVTLIPSPKHWRVTCVKGTGDKICLPPGFAITNKNGNLWLSSQKAIAAGTFRFAIQTW